MPVVPVLDFQSALRGIRAQLDQLGESARLDIGAAPSSDQGLTQRPPVETVTRLVLAGDVVAAVFDLSSGPASVIAPGTRPSLAIAEMEAVLPLVPPGSILQIGTALTELRAFCFDGVAVCMEPAPGAAGRVDAALTVLLECTRPVEARP